MALFAVNTGCRDAEICNLQWGWEVEVPELGTSVFIIPGSRVKNGEERVVVLNRISPVGRRCEARQTCHLRVHLQGTCAEAHVEHEVGRRRGRGQGYLRFGSTTSSTPSDGAFGRAA